MPFAYPRFSLARHDLFDLLGTKGPQPAPKPAGVQQNKTLSLQRRPSVFQKCMPMQTNLPGQSGSTSEDQYADYGGITLMTRNTGVCKIGKDL